jgi:hypothetical protein
LGTKYLVVLCAGSTLLLAKQNLDEAPYKLSGAVAKLAGITFGRLSPSYWIDYLGFITEEKLATIFIKPSLGVSNWPVIFTSSTNANKFSGTIITVPSRTKSTAFIIFGSIDYRVVQYNTDTLVICQY